MLGWLHDAGFQHVHHRVLSIAPLTGLAQARRRWLCVATRTPTPTFAWPTPLPLSRRRVLHPLTEELSFVRSIPAAAKSLSPSSAEKTVFSEAVDGVVTQAGMVNLVCDHSDLVGGTRCLALHMSAKATEWELDPGFHFVCGAPVTNEDKGSCGRHAHTQDRMILPRTCGGGPRATPSSLGTASKPT